ncbi:MAG: hypothetical protein SGBAC_011215 [Bacillariaceae sp.]
MRKALLLSLRASASRQIHFSSHLPHRRINGVTKIGARLMASSSTSQTAASFVIPRAAVAVTAQAILQGNKDTHYLLIQRKNPPDAGKWSLPGGKIELGEATLEAAQRELTEETGLKASDCQWYPYPFMTTDAIFPTSDGSSYAFHYLIAQCFAQYGEHEKLPAVEAMDDALNAKWWTSQEIQTQLVPDKAVSAMVVDVISRAEELCEKGSLNTK